MKKFITVVTVIMLLLAGGCSSKKEALSTLVKCNVLCANGASHGETSYMEILDTDSLGRTLFKYHKYIAGSFGYEQLSVIAISQKTSNHTVFYYEDTAFIVADTFDEILDSDIEALKQENDWDQPIATEKLSSRDQNARFIHNININVNDILRSHVELPPESVLSGRIVDFDKNDRVLFYIAASTLDPNHENKYTQSYYLMIVNTEGELCSDKAIAEIKDIYNYQTEMHQLKVDNDWIFH